MISILTTTFALSIFYSVATVEARTQERRDLEKFEQEMGNGN